MRILRVAQKLYPEVKGGGPYHVHAMSRDQAAMGHDVTVLTVGDGPQREEQDGYTVLRSPSRASVLGNDIAPGIWRELRNADEFDVVHAHSHLYLSTNLAALRRRLSETPLAITNHGLYSQTVSEWVFDAYLRTIGRWTFNSADVVFCYTEEDERRLHRVGVSSRTAVVNNGIDTERFSPKGDQDPRIDADGPVMLFVGRLVEGKRPMDAVEAFAELRERLPDVELYVCGEGPLRSEMAQRAQESGISKAVTFLGHVDYEEIPSVYRSADVLVLPSRAEGLPRTVLEALASGVPAVVSDLPQVRRIVEEGGRTVPVGDVSGFARALATVLSESYDPRAAVGRDLSWDDTVRETTEMLSSL